MGKPVKIRKKKSFMFTTRHYSLTSMIGLALAAICIISNGAMTFISYKNAGKVDIGFGGVGLFSVLLNVIGIIFGSLSLKERDVYITPGIVAIVINAAMIAGWIVIKVLSRIA